ncbi:MAG: hypothetical protein L0154_22665 [Chloroflexi bacterium]|nr:hypothetical protein [Chloroflexota bacterium]
MAATIYYIRDTRPANHDTMGAAMMFDDVMLPSLVLLSIGIALANDLRWWWAIVLFVGFFFIIGMGYKFTLVYLLDWFLRR